MHTLLKLFSLALVVLTTGCAQMTMGTPQPTAENTASLRQAKLEEARVGAFTLDAGKPAQMDKGHSLRGAQMQAPTNGSFAEYLRESLRVELAAAGLLNPQADAVISGFLTHTDVAPDIGTGTAALSARFVVTRGGAKRYEQELSVQSEW